MQRRFKWVGEEPGLSVTERDAKRGRLVNGPVTSSAASLRAESSPDCSYPAILSQTCIGAPKHTGESFIPKALRTQ